MKIRFQTPDCGEIYCDMIEGMIEVQADAGDKQAVADLNALMAALVDDDGQEVEIDDAMYGTAMAVRENCIAGGSEPAWFEIEMPPTAAV